MEFNPNNNVIKLCLQGMDLVGKGKPEELQKWREKLANVKGDIIN